MIYVDSNLHELVQHGSLEFPFIIYPDSYKKFKDKYYYMHYHEEYEIIIPTIGEIDVTVNNNLYHLKQHEFLLINSNNLHNIEHTNYPNSNIFAIVFSKRLIELNKTSIIETNILNELLSKKFEAIKIYDENLYKEIETNNQVIFKKEPGYQLLALILILKLFYKIYTNYDNLNIIENTSKSNLRIRNAIDYINKNYDNYITVDDIAQVCGMSSAETSRLFKRVIGKAPIEYLLEYRIKMASILLLKTDKIITDIATSTGFSSSNYFTIAFKKIMGTTPKEYRKKLKK